MRYFVCVRQIERGEGLEETAVERERERVGRYDRDLGEEGEERKRVGWGVRVLWKERREREIWRERCE